METPYGEIPNRFAEHMRPQEMHDYLKNRYGRRTVLKGAPAAVEQPLHDLVRQLIRQPLEQPDERGRACERRQQHEHVRYLDRPVPRCVGGERHGGARDGGRGSQRASGVSSGGSTENDPAYVADAPFSSWRYATWSHLTVTVTAPTTSGGTTSMLVQGVDANVSPTVVMDSVTIIWSSVVQPPAATSEIGAEDLLVVAGGAVLGAGVYAAHRKAQRERIFVSGQAPLN